MDTDNHKAFESQGYATVRRVLERQELSTVSRCLERLGVRRAGTRSLLELAWCRALVQRVKRRIADDGPLPASYVAVQCTLFDKTPERNWLVAAHQDLSIPVLKRVNDPSLKTWSRKEGGDYVQPPVEVLQQLVAARVHVDACNSRQGPLKVVPGSHKAGRLSRAELMEIRAKIGEDECLADAGDVLLMRPLLLHASSKASAPSRRRVLHVLFGPASLPFGLAWKHSV